MRIHHFGIWAGDMEKAVGFYSDFLGLKKEREYEAPASLMESVFGYRESCRIEVYGDGDVRVELFEGKQMRGINHISLSVGDREQFCATARALGQDVIEVRRGDSKVCFVRGPEGVLLEIKD